MQFQDIVNHCKEIRQTLSNSEFDPIQDFTPILGDGSLNAKIMVVARDLGRDEVLLKKPLIGRAGQLVRWTIKDLKISDTTYLTNLVPYKPVNNKAFSPTIRKMFMPILAEQISLIKPKCIITLGRESAEEFLKFRGALMQEITQYIVKSISYYHKNILGTEVDGYILPAVHPSWLVRLGINPDDFIYIEPASKLYFYNVFKLAKIFITKKGV